MIGFRHADARFPFLWEDEAQPAARWHGDGEGPAHYLAETPDGAWAEFLRHEGITDASDVATVRRALWAVELPDDPLPRPLLGPRTLAGGLRSYRRCRQEARRLRRGGAIGLEAPSAALRPRTPSGWRVEGGMRPGPAREERVLVLFGPRPEIVGWAACIEGRPREDLLPRVRQL
ncbi:MAG: RES domain-containing protein [Candidatus Limnocylindria bacterium]